MYYLVFKTS